MAGLKIVGHTLLLASNALQSAGRSFESSATVSVGADYGSGSVSAAVSELAAALRSASSVSGDQASAKAAWATQTQADFSALETNIAAAACFDGSAK